MRLFALEIGHGVGEGGLEAFAIGERRVETGHIDLTGVLLPNCFTRAEGIHA